MFGIKTSSVILALLSVMVYQVSSSQTCLNCKRKDTNAGFLYSYSYCPDNDNEKCIADYWNYISSDCEGEVKDGWQLDIDKDCAAYTQQCF